MLIEQSKITVYDIEKNRENIENSLTGFEYSRSFNHIVCVNMVCFKTYFEDIMSELQFFKKEGNLIIFYEEMKAGEKYDGDRQVQFLKENGFYCTSNCLCVGVNASQLTVDSIKDSMEKAHFI